MMTTFNSSTQAPPQQMGQYLPLLQPQNGTHPVNNLQEWEWDPVAWKDTIRLEEIAKEHIKDIQDIYVNNQLLNILEFTDESPFKGRICIDSKNLSANDRNEYARIQLLFCIKQQEGIHRQLDRMSYQLNRMSYEIMPQVDQNSAQPPQIESARVDPTSIVPENKGVFSIIGDTLAWPFLKIYDLIKCLFCCCNSRG